MKNVKNALIGILILSVSASIVIGGLQSFKDNQQEKAKAEAQEEVLAEIRKEMRSGHGYDPTPDPWVVKRQKKDSLLKTITSKTISTIPIKRDTAQLNRYDLLPSRKVQLVNVIRYMSWGEILGGQFSDLYLSELETQVKVFLGLKVYKMKSWENAMRKGVSKFKTAFSKKERAQVAECLSFNAGLVDGLNKLSNKDQERLFVLMNRIVYQQEKDESWIYKKESNSTFLEQHNLLKKVWPMPRLYESFEQEDGGTCYTLGKKLDRNLYGGDYYMQNYQREWKTRHLNEFQFCIGMVHRRLLAINPQDDEQRREVIAKVAHLLHEGAAELKK